MKVLIVTKLKIWDNVNEGKFKQEVYYGYKRKLGFFD